MVVLEVKGEMTAANICAMLQHTFLHQWGFPLKISSDSGPPFQSAEFVNFFTDRGVEIQKSVEEKARTNGAVERKNRDLVAAMRKVEDKPGAWRAALEEFVHLKNNMIVMGRIGATPFELMTGRQFRGQLPTLFNKEVITRESAKDKDKTSKYKAKIYSDKTRKATEHNLKIGDVVYMKKRASNKLSQFYGPDLFKITEINGVKITITSERGVSYSRHVEDVRKVSREQGFWNEPDEVADGCEDQMEVMVRPIEEETGDDLEMEEDFPVDDSPGNMSEESREEEADERPTEEMKLRRSGRTVVRPARYLCNIVNMFTGDRKV